MDVFVLLRLAYYEYKVTGCIKYSLVELYFVNRMAISHEFYTHTFVHCVPPLLITFL